jgi:hypothetical protein
MLAIRIWLRGLVMASRLVRANAVTVNDVRDGHKLLEIDCADRVSLTFLVPSLLVGGQVVSFLTAHERNPIPSPALLERRGLAFSRAALSFAEANDIPVFSFADKRDKGQPGCWPSTQRRCTPARPAQPRRQGSARLGEAGCGSPPWRSMEPAITRSTERSRHSSLRLRL